MNYVIKNGHVQILMFLAYNSRVSSLILGKGYFAFSLTYQVLQFPPSSQKCVGRLATLNCPRCE